MRQKIVLATHNLGKVRECSAFLDDVSVDLIAISAFSSESPVENGQTFVENALIKARHAAQLSRLPALADDSGLVVDALNGAPGIYSARYAGVDASDAENIEKLLTALRDVPTPQRTARFYCALVLLRHVTDPTPLICTGSWEGVIAEASRGAGGFGYDPVFFVPSLQKTAAALDVITKNQLSHRGQALRQLRDQWLWRIS